MTTQNPGILSPERRVERAITAYAVTREKGDYDRAVVEKYGYDMQATKAAISAFTTADVGSTTSESADFMQHLIRNSALMQMLPFMHQTDFYAPCNDPLGASAAWVAAGSPIPLYGDTLTTHQLDRLKAAAISVFSKEALKQLYAESFVSAALASACSNVIDAAFLDGGSGVPNETPRSIAHGAVTLSATADPVHDFKSLFQNMDLSRAFLISDTQTCARLGLTVTSGAGIFADCGARGGSIAGVNLITTENSPHDSNGGRFVLIDPTRILVALGGVNIARDDEGSLQMIDEIDSNGSGGRVSLFTTDSVALRVTMHANWKLLDSNACRVLVGADW